MVRTPRRLAALLIALLVVAPAVLLGEAAPRDDTAAVQFFEKKIRPLLANNCHTCHSANTKTLGGLRVDDRNGLVHGGDHGPAVVPGHPEQSLLIRAVRGTDKNLHMPPKKQLSAEQIADLARWIQDGAAWPRPRLPGYIGKSNAHYARLRKEHWAWQPLRVPQPPAVSNADWARGEIDRFILAEREAKGLQPVRDADRSALIRRVTFDLTGLPPTPEAVDAFIEDNSANAFQKVVDRLLASPAFGERWGRHWLDVARYGESTGSSRNVPYPHAWRYRDYVLDAFNHDKPYDQFLREQIAGDLLPAASPRQMQENLIATGFLALGVKDVNQRFKVRFVMDNIDEQIDTVTRSVLALTASCARCHDHKFDPIPTTDYYALAGIFHSTELCAGVRNKMGGGGLDYYDTTMLLPLSVDQRQESAVAKVRQAQAELARARADLVALRDDPDKNVAGRDGERKLAAARKRIDTVQKELIALTDPAANAKVALGVRDARTVGDTEIRIRGEAEKRGPLVPRGFLSVVEVPGSPAINPNQSGRLELAHWLTSARNPLAARVIANRVWHYLLGRGLVTSVDNFGVTGDVPSHPQLLDHLASCLVRDGWSIKKLVRAVVLSRTYQLGSEAVPMNVGVDPSNRLLWRHAPRRLEAEEIRDAMLAAAGQLDLGRPAGSPAQHMKVIELPNNAAEARRLEEAGRASRYRSVYLPLLRGLTPRSLEVFDFAEQGMVTGSRDTTTVSTQALYLLNDSLVQQLSRALANRLLQRTELNNASRIELAYRLTVGRAATEREIEMALRYLADYEAVGGAAAGWPSFCQALFATAEFRYVL